VDVATQDGEKTVYGRIDLLALLRQIWVVVIESKQAGFSLKDATAQTLFYMMANPNPEPVTFGLVTNGSHFIFIKLIQNNSIQNKLPQYAFSSEFSLFRTENELYTVCRILKHLADLAVSRSA
jgi:predicted type IV restriction endonuclease